MEVLADHLIGNNLSQAVQRSTMLGLSFKDSI